MTDGPRDVSDLMAIEDDPTKYRPQKGDILELCPHIRIEVKYVTSNGRVGVRDIQPRPSNVDNVIHLEGRPDPDPAKVPPLGVKTWATEKGALSVQDLQRLLRHGWSLRPSA